MTQRKRDIKIRVRRKQHPDVRRLSQALLALAQAQAERDAQAQAEGQKEVAS